VTTSDSEETRDFSNADAEPDGCGVGDEEARLGKCAAQGGGEPEDGAGPCNNNKKSKTRNTLENIQYKDKLYKRTSRIARKNASIFPLIKPLGGEVCRSTVNPAIIEANTRSATRCCALRNEVTLNKAIVRPGRNLRRDEQSNK
jgi:hypothetical protein